MRMLKFSVGTLLGADQQKGRLSELERPRPSCIHAKRRLGRLRQGDSSAGKGGLLCGRQWKRLWLHRRISREIPPDYPVGNIAQRARTRYAVESGLSRESRRCGDVARGVVEHSLKLGLLE